ncbi:MAG TPA: hypothetical protein DDW45_00075 [Gammaproteobacteria bacterium]|nr:hypothetical protein [Gammaproteobacteria bacterium]
MVRAIDPAADLEEAENDHKTDHAAAATTGKAGVEADKRTEQTITQNEKQINHRCTRIHTDIMTSPYLCESVCICGKKELCNKPSLHVRQSMT